MLFCHRLIFFSKSRFSNSSFSMSSSLDPDKAWHFVRPDLGPNCLQRLSAQVGKETTAKQKFAKKLLPRVKKVNCNLFWFFVWTVNLDTNKSFTCQWHLMFSAMHRSKGEGGQGVLTPHSLENHKKLWSSLAILVQILWKITKLPSQRSTVGHHRPASETPFKWPYAGGPMMVHFK